MASKPASQSKLIANGLYNLLANVLLSHVPLSWFRRWVWRCLLGRMGRQCHLGYGVRVLKPANVRLGNRVVVNSGAILDGRGGVLSIEDDADIGESVALWTLQHDPDDENHGVRGAPVAVGHHAWLAPRAIILPGVTIGPGAVVATGAVVTKDVAPSMMVGGAPAKPLRPRRNSCQYQLHFKPWFV
jgi:acetyltransferase-like isoleucine patch superfamily enzyme